MEPADDAVKGEAPELRREARTALGGRVPVVLSVVIALLAGGLLGYGWRVVICDRECQRARAEIVIRRCAVPLASEGEPPRLILIDEQSRAASPCPAAAAAATLAAPPASPATTPPR
ncbi:MAG TPA: hypothetical protein VK698_32685 [Kofleriaceae bacterium]|nr:hypothetical protein [Kofleriaceae bacterium]